jgi:hypothetical protein
MMKRNELFLPKTMLFRVEINIEDWHSDVAWQVTEMEFAGLNELNF